MSKKIVYLIGILLTIVIGSIFFQKNCCNSIPEPPLPPPPTPVENTQITVPAVVTPAPDLNLVKDSLNADPLVFYFNTSESGITLTKQETRKIESILNYLDKVPDGSVVVTGYTDNSGSREANLKLGQDRAEFIKSFLVKKGITEGRISATSSGPDGPVASNDTPEGKAKNRRTVVSIK